MNSRSLIHPRLFLFIITLMVYRCGSHYLSHAKYEIAPASFEQLAEQYLQHLADRAFEDSYMYLANDVVFKLPDGDTDTRTTYRGLDQVKEFWDHYVEKSGNDKSAFTDFVHIPVRVNQQIKPIEVTGVFDICYFSAALSYGTKVAHVRMHWALHFNKDNKIDGIYSYYDRTPIMNAAGKNILSAN